MCIRDRVAKVLHSTIGNGIVTSIDTSEAEALPGVVKVVTFKDVPDHCYPCLLYTSSFFIAEKLLEYNSVLTRKADNT